VTAPEDLAAAAKAAPSHPRVARGKRPHFFPDESSDTLLSMNLALLTELMATRERLDTLERLMAERGLLDRAAFETYQPDPVAEQEREQLRTTMANHVFYLLLQEAERAAKVSEEAAGLKG
jgi:hypothetical protein